MFDYYCISGYIVPKFLSAGRYVAFIATTISLIALSAAVRSGLAVLITTYYFHEGATDFKRLYFISFVNIGGWVLLITIAKMLMDRKEVQRRVVVLEKERITNELNYLKAQINPHALFNSLNTIYGHIDRGNSTARNILLQFSGLLRYQLYDCNEERVKLGREIQFVKDYINFQKLRKDERLIVVMDVVSIDPNLYIAPLLLIVLIENAFKFVSSYPDKENVISLKITTNRDEFFCSLYNTKDACQLPAGKESSNGIGIINLQRRLALLYPNRFQLLINDQKTSYDTSLRIKL
jgi:LytS/YehU family sensor histidine kinase